MVLGPNSRFERHVSDTKEVVQSAVFYVITVQDNGERTIEGIYARYNIQ